jgi:Glycosyltransferase family 87
VTVCLAADGRSDPVVKLALLGAMTVFIVGCVFSIGGLADGRDWGDVNHYQRFGTQVMDGREPYHDFYMEYPPGALPAFVLPATVTDGKEAGAYRFRFKLEMTLLGAAALVAAAAILRLLAASRERTLTALAAIALAPAALGHVFLNRYDLWPALLLVGSLLVLLLSRAAAGGALLGALFAAKLFAPIALPLTAIRLSRTGGERAVGRAAAAFVLVSLLAFGYFTLTAFGGLGFSVKTQLVRHLQTESLGASLLFAADRLGIYHARIIFGAPGSLDLSGTVADTVGVLTTVAAIGAVLAVAAVCARRELGSEGFVVAFVATVVGFVAFAKVLSPQYVVWLVPLVPLVRGRTGAFASTLLLICLVLTQLENYGFTGGHLATWAVWTILLRNVALVALYAQLLRVTARAPRAVPDAAPRSLLAEAPQPS